VLDKSSDEIVFVDSGTIEVKVLVIIPPVTFALVAAAPPPLELLELLLDDVVQSLHVTDEENALVLLPSWKPTVPEALPTVIVHCKVVVLLAPTDIVADVASPDDEYPEGREREYEVVVAEL
jgi:hypothetical protein